MDRMTACDVEATYCGTYLNVEINGEWTPCYIEEAEGEDGYESLLERCYVRNVRTGRCEGIDLFDGSVDFDWPELGYVNCSGYAVYVRRQARRQWKRGVRGHECDLTISSVEHGCTMDLRRPRFEDKSFLINLFNREYSKFGTALLKVELGIVASEAFSHSFAVGVEHDINEYILYYKGHPVGVVRDGVPQIAEGLSHLQPELERSLDGHC